MSEEQEKRSVLRGNVQRGLRSYLKQQVSQDSSEASVDELVAADSSLAKIWPSQEDSVEIGHGLDQLAKKEAESKASKAIDQYLKQSGEGLNRELEQETDKIQQETHEPPTRITSPNSKQAEASTATVQLPSSAEPAPLAGTSIQQNYANEQQEELVKEAQALLQSLQVDTQHQARGNVFAKPESDAQRKGFASKKETGSRTAEQPIGLSPYQSYLQQLQRKDLDFLIKESAAPVAYVVLQNIPRKLRAQILMRMPKDQRNTFLRGLAQRKEAVGLEEFPKVFHWLERKLRNHKAGFERIAAEEESADEFEVQGSKALSNILDSVNPTDEMKILRDLELEDPELYAWLERERGSLPQRFLLKQTLPSLAPKEIAALYSLPKLARVLRHFLDHQKMIGVLEESVSLAQQGESLRQAELDRVLEKYPAFSQWLG